MNIGCRLLSSSRMLVRRLQGQVSGGPSGDADQSYARMSAPSSPPPARNAGVWASAARGISALPFTRSRSTADPDNVTEPSLRLPMPGRPQPAFGPALEPDDADVRLYSSQARVVLRSR